MSCIKITLKSVTVFLAKILGKPIRNKILKDYAYVNLTF